jgi:hypothetical protein
MFSLIITLVSIALVAALALTTIYYGGAAYREHGSNSAAAKIVLEGQQISAAIDIFRTTNDGNFPESMAALTFEKKFLSSVPNNLWEFSPEYVVYPMDDIKACQKANKNMGYESPDIPQCSAVTGKTICCQQ